MALSQEQLKEFYPMIKKLARKYNIILMVDCSLFPYIAIHKENIRNLEYFDINGCNGGNAFIAVDVDGSFKPCSFWNESFDSIEKLNYEYWVSNKKLEEFRRGVESKICSKCNYLHLCNNGCKLYSDWSNCEIF